MTSLTISFENINIPAGSSSSLILYEDVGNTGTIDNQDTIPLEDGKTAYATADVFDGSSGNAYRVRPVFSTSDVEVGASQDWTLTVDTTNEATALASETNVDATGEESAVASSSASAGSVILSSGSATLDAAVSSSTTAGTIPVTATAELAAATISGQVSIPTEKAALIGYPSVASTSSEIIFQAERAGLDAVSRTGAGSALTISDGTRGNVGAVPLLDASTSLVVDGTAVAAMSSTPLVPGVISGTTARVDGTVELFFAEPLAGGIVTSATAEVEPVGLGTATAFADSLSSQVGANTIINVAHREVQPEIIDGSSESDAFADSVRGVAEFLFEQGFVETDAEAAAVIANAIATGAVATNFVSTLASASETAFTGVPRMVNPVSAGSAVVQPSQVSFEEFAASISASGVAPANKAKATADAIGAVLDIIAVYIASETGDNSVLLRALQDIEVNSGETYARIQD